MVSVPSPYRLLTLSDGWLKVKRGDIYLRDGRPSLSNGEPRLLIGLHQLLIDTGKRRYLIDAGLGELWSPEELGLLGFQKPRRLLEQLHQLGYTRDDVDGVILTHLHYDHCGGLLKRTERGLENTFTKSVYYIQRREWEFASNPPPERVGDFRAEVLEVLYASGRLELVEGEVIIDKNLRLVPMPGHTPGHQGVILDWSGGRLIAPGDLISTVQHTDLRTFMTYDFDPLEVLNQRRILLTDASSERAFLFLAHSYRYPWARLVKAPGKEEMAVKLIREEKDTVYL